MEFMIIPVLGKAAIDVDGTFFVQLGVFFFLLFFLWGVLIKPYLATVEKRQEKSEGQREDAQEMQARAERLIDEYDEKLQAARREAKGVRDTLRDEGAKDQEQQLEAERRRLAEKLQEERKVLGAQVTKARGQIEGRAEELANAMVEKVVPGV